MMRITKRERLQTAWERDPLMMEVEIEFRPFKGWYAMPNEGRHFGDEGDFLGANYAEALAWIERLAPKTRVA